jgi:transposase
MSKKQWSTAEKKLIVLEMLKGQKSVSQISKEYGISDSMAYLWRDKALKSIDEGFSRSKNGSDQSVQAERDRLLKIVGEQTIVIDTLKKISAMS